MSNATTFVPAAATIPGPIADTRRPRVNFPAGACDCHAHVFGPQREYPFAPGGGYVPPECSIDDYVRMLRAIGCARAVIVHPSVYGTDNRCTIDALRSGKFAFRGVAVIDEPNTTDSQLEDMHRAGVRGVRINLKSKGAVVGINAAPRLAERIKARGWHIQFFLDTNTMPDIDQKMVKLPVDIVIDHFGHIETAHGMQAPGFRTLLRLARHVYLEQDPHRLTRAPVQLRGQLQRIERLNHREASRDELRLVALQMPDQMPARRRIGDRVLLVQRFLDAVLPDLGQARRQRRAHGVRPESLGHRHDRDAVRDLGPHLCQPLREGLKTHSRQI